MEPPGPTGKPELDGTGKPPVEADGAALAEKDGAEVDKKELPVGELPAKGVEGEEVGDGVSGVRNLNREGQVVELP